VVNGACYAYLRTYLQFSKKNIDANLGDADHNNNKVNVIHIAW